ncbi:MAG: AAA family ATPase, partial [Oscillochloris sp.]|nr:AAA family ATPase [Oscillochloris sp.]
MDIPINVVCSEQQYTVETRLLLTTKLRIPQPQPHTIARPHLFIRLEQAFDTPLTLVIAPAGFGKTTLLASWLTLARQEARYPSAPAWLALDDHDNAPERLVHALIAAIQATQPQIGNSTHALLMSGSNPEVALQELISEITQTTRPLLLVIDEIHLLTMPAAVAILATLIAHQPPALHLILAGRTDPQLPLTRLRASGQLSELRATDLCLSNDETAAFLSQTMGLTLTALQVAQLIQRVEGWVAGFQLIALALRQATDPVTHAAALAGRHRFVLDYLFDEVLSQQAPEVQHFLLHTAILDRLCDSLCDAMLEGIGDQPAGPPHAASILESLERSSLFLVPLDGEQRWYRYHHLFADLLRHQLRQHHPKRVADLHRRAASWFAENGFVDAALHHAFAGGDSPLAAKLIAVEGRTRLIRGELATLRGWLAALPEVLVAACPR